MLEKAKIIPVDKEAGGPVTVMFNPNEYTVSNQSMYTNTSNDKDKKNNSLSNQKQFDKYTRPEFRVSLFYDTYEKHMDVRLLTKRITDLMYPVVPGKETKRPPVCRFLWGGFTYQGVITKVDEKFTMFLPSGIPVRATLEVTFEEDLPENQLKKNAGREACRKLWSVKSGDRLDLIANEALKDPTKWRVIAEANKITNPFSFPETKDFGRTLVIPDLG